MPIWLLPNVTLNISDAYWPPGQPAPTPCSRDRQRSSLLTFVQHLESRAMHLGEREQVLLQVVHRFMGTQDFSGFEHWVPPQWRGDAEIVLAGMVFSDARILETGSKRLHDSRTLVLLAISTGWPLSPSYASRRLLDDCEIIAAGVRHSGQALMHAPDAMRADKAFVMSILSRPRIMFETSCLEHCSPELRADRELVEAAVRQDPYAIAEASDELQDDRELVLLALTTQRASQAGHMLRYASEALRRDRDLVLTAVRLDWKALLYADDELRQDPEFGKAMVLEAIACHGCVPLAHSNPEDYVTDVDGVWNCPVDWEWWLDRDIQVAAAQPRAPGTGPSTREFLKLAPPELRREVEVILAA